MSLPTSGYDAHQRLRAKVVRLLNKKNYDKATQALYDGSLAQLAAGEQASGADLAVYMVDVYGQQHAPVDSTRTEHVLQILAQLADDWWRQKFVLAVVKWAEPGSASPKQQQQQPQQNHEDPERVLRRRMGEVLWSKQHFHAAEAHLVAALPNPASLPALGQEEVSPAVQLGLMMVDWLLDHAQRTVEQQQQQQQQQQQEGARGNSACARGPEPTIETEKEKEATVRTEAGRFVLRGLLLLLVSGQVPAALAFLDTFLRTLVSKPEAANLLLPVTPNPKTFVPPQGVQPPARLAPPLVPGGEPSYEQPLWLTGNVDVNFAQMLLGIVDAAYRLKGEGPAFAASPGGRRGAVPRPLAQAYMALVGHYQKDGIAIQVDEMVAASLNALPSLYLDAPAAKGGNMLADMMSGLLGGGGGSASAARPTGTEWPGYRPWPAPELLHVAADGPAGPDEEADEGAAGPAAEEELDLD